MDDVRTVQLKESIIRDNDLDAEKLRGELADMGVFYINVMSSPGSGKTTLLCALTKALLPKCKIGVMEADIDGDVDAYTVREAGAQSIQLHTGGMCHLDADMSRQGFKEFGTSADIVFLENIGNLVCPAEFDTGAHLNMMLLSVPEGDDKPLKYPLMFQKCDIVVVTKIDTLEAFDFDMQAFEKHIKNLNENAQIFPVSAKTGEGVDSLENTLYKKIKFFGKGENING